MNALLPNIGDYRETSDTYSAEIYRLENWRIIVCKDGLQWILQRLTRSNSAKGGQWEGQSYFRTREAALRLWRAKTGDDGAVLTMVLPERFIKQK